MPTLRLPPVEARALRRQVAADAGVDVPNDSSEVEVEVEVEAAPPPTTALRSMPGPSRLHRPPLPMPDVLRQGPRPSPRRVAEGGEVPVAPRAAVPEPMMVIDTASLVLEAVEALAPTPAAIEPVVTIEPSRAIDPVAATEPAATEATAPSVATTPTIVPVASFVADAPAIEMPRRRSRAVWWIAFAGAAASVAAAVWTFAPSPEGARGGTAPRAEQAEFVHAEVAPEHVVTVADDTAAAPAKPPTPVEAVAPAPEPAVAPAVVPTPAIEPTPLPTTGTPPAPAIAMAEVLPTTGEPDEPDLEVVEEDPAPAVAAPAPAKPKSSKPAKKSKKVKKSSAHAAPAPSKPGKLAAPAPRAPAPALDATALLRDAEKAFAEGRYGTALRNAQRSLAARNDPRAARILVISACKLGREEVARANLDRVPLGQRRGVRNTCKDAGVKV